MKLVMLLIYNLTSRYKTQWSVFHFIAGFGRSVSQEGAVPRIWMRNIIHRSKSKPVPILAVKSVNVVNKTTGMKYEMKWCKLFLT